MGNWNVKIVENGYSINRDVFIFRRVVGTNKTEFMVGNTIQTIDDDVVHEPSLRLTPEMLQAFSDALDSQGFKPQKGFIEGKLEATENHLKDMRTLLKLK